MVITNPSGRMMNSGFIWSQSAYDSAAASTEVSTPHTREVDGALLHGHVDVEEPVADDRRPEHEREHHVGRNAHRVDEVRRRHEPGEDEPGEVDDAADQAHQGAQQDQGRAVPPEAGIDVLVDPDQVREPVDEEEVEVEEERRVQETRRRRPSPVRRLHAVHEQRRAAQVDDAEDEGQRVRDEQRRPVPGRARGRSGRSDSRTPGAR